MLFLFAVQLLLQFSDVLKSHTQTVSQEDSMHFEYDSDGCSSVSPVHYFLQMCLSA